MKESTTREVQSFTDLALGTSHYETSIKGNNETYTERGPDSETSQERASETYRQAEK